MHQRQNFRVDDCQHVTSGAQKLDHFGKNGFFCVNVFIPFLNQQKIKSKYTRILGFNLHRNFRVADYKYMTSKTQKLDHFGENGFFVLIC